MNKLTKILKAGVLMLIAAIAIAGPVFAEDLECINGSGEYPNLQKTEEKVAPDEFPIYCTTYHGAEDTYFIYAKNSSACSQAAAIVSNPDTCNSEDLSTTVRTIINTVIFAVGMVAVVMIILGGVNYATSQGDPNKVNKAKSTIMYGIIGLVVCLLAFAIVSFVLQALA